MMSDQSHNSQAFEHAIRDIEALSPLFKNKKFKELMDKVAFTSEKSKEKVMGASLPEKDELTLQLMMLVSKIYDSYRSAQQGKSEMADVIIRTAIQLSEEQERSFIEKIKKSRGADIVVRFEYNPGLIGGVQIYEKNTFVDYSLHTQLQKLEKQLKSE